MPSKTQKIIVFILFILALGLHAGFSIRHRTLQAAWANVPPVPSESGAVAMAAGDRQLAYRSIGTIIQNLGNTGGNAMPLKDYDYNRLGEWFFLQDKLDSRSNFINVLAAYYFGGTQNPQQLDPVIDYLAVAGQHLNGERWYWLAHAVYLARFKQEDNDKAMRLAHLLAGLDNPDMPLWARQMPAFIANASGDKKAALGMMLAVLRDGSQNLSRNEVNFMVDYICNRILEDSEKPQYEICAKK